MWNQKQKPSTLGRVVLLQRLGRGPTSSHRGEEVGHSRSLSRLLPANPRSANSDGSMLAKELPRGHGPFGNFARRLDASLRTLRASPARGKAGCPIASGAKIARKGLSSGRRPKQKASKERVAMQAVLFWGIPQRPFGAGLRRPIARGPRARASRLSRPKRVVLPEFLRTRRCLGHRVWTRCCLLPTSRILFANPENLGAAPAIAIPCRKRLFGAKPTGLLLRRLHCLTGLHPALPAPTDSAKNAMRMIPLFGRVRWTTTKRLRCCWMEGHGPKGRAQNRGNTTQKRPTMQRATLLQQTTEGKRVFV
jgi:hypothetical protein